MTTLIILQAIILIIAIACVIKALEALFFAPGVMPKVIGVMAYSGVATAGIYILQAGIAAWMVWYIGITIAAAMAIPVMLLISTLVLLLIYKAMRIDRKWESKKGDLNGARSSSAGAA